MLERTDWQYETMKDICYVNQGFQINIEKREKHKRKNNKIYITIQHLNGVGDNEYIKDIDHNDSVVCSPDDVLMTRTGNTGRVVTDVSGVFHNNFFRINFDRSRIDKGYLVYYLNQKNIQNLILEKAGTSTIPDLNHGDFYSIPFNYPKELKEQRKIASSLSNVDNLIENLQLLINKKKKILDGMKQTYLYKNNWNRYNVSQLFYIGRGRVINHDEINSSSNNAYPVYSSQTTNDGIMGFIGTYDFDGEYITWTTDGANAGEVYYRKGRFNCTNVCGTLKLKDEKKNDYRFISYLLNRECKKYVSTNLANPKLMNNTMGKVEILIPNDVNEQKSISSILDNVENEIEILKDKLSKYKKIKDGMMEDLLTGKVRLSYE